MQTQNFLLALGIALSTSLQGCGSDDDGKDKTVDFTCSITKRQVTFKLAKPGNLRKSDDKEKKEDKKDDKKEDKKEDKKDDPKVQVTIDNKDAADGDKNEIKDVELQNIYIVKKGDKEFRVYAQLSGKSITNAPETLKKVSLGGAKSKDQGKLETDSKKPEWCKDENFLFSVEKDLEGLKKLAKDKITITES